MKRTRQNRTTWKPEEDQYIAHARSRGETWDSIGAKLGRKSSSVFSHAYRLNHGLIKQTAPSAPSVEEEHTLQPTHLATIKSLEALLDCIHELVAEVIMIGVDQRMDLERKEHDQKIKSLEEQLQAAKEQAKSIQKNKLSGLIRGF